MSISVMFFFSFFERAHAARRVGRGGAPHARCAPTTRCPSTGYRPVYVPGLRIEREIDGAGRDRARGRRSRGGRGSCAAPPMVQCRPMSVLPAMPVQPAIAVCAPMRQLWPTWIWLSSFTPSSITVSSSAPRSMVVLAPISTSSPMRTAPICGILIQRPASSAMPKPSAPITAPEWTMHARAERAAVRRPPRADRGSCRRRSSRRRRSRSPRRCDTRAPSCASVAPITAEGCTPGAWRDQRIEELRHAREVRVGIVAHDARQRGQRPRPPRPRITAAGARRGELGAVLRARRGR